MEHKSWAGEFKTIDSGSGGFEGFASLFGILDSGNDIVEKGAFASSLAEFVKDGFISLGHDWNGLAIGTIKDAYENDDGLFLKTEYHSTPEAQSARKVAQERLQRGKSVGLSIGFGIKPNGMKSDTEGVRHLTDVHLFEVAQVNVPMLRPAGLTMVKGIGMPFDEHSENVRVAIDEWLERVRSGSDVRLKAGRAISEARRGRIAAVREALLAGASEIEALLKETEPPESKPEDAPPELTELAAVDPELRAIFERLAKVDALFGVRS